MYEDFFGFNRRPFDLTPNPQFLVLTDSHREALSNLEYGIASKKGITLLLGEAGSGKTTIIRAALERQPQRVHCVHLHNPTLTRDEFVEMLAARFELSDEAKHSKTSLLLELEALLKEPAGPRRGDGARHRRGAEPAAGFARGDSPAREHRDRRRQAAVGDHRRPAGAHQPPQRRVAAAAEAADRAAVRARPLTLQETAGLHRGTHPRGRRRRCARVHARGRRAHSRAVAGHSRARSASSRTTRCSAGLPPASGRSRARSCAMSAGTSTSRRRTRPGRPLTNGHTADSAERILNVGPRHVEDPSKKPVPTELFEGFAAKRKRFSFFGN